jgi:hypothetical protein
MGKGNRSRGRRRQGVGGLPTSEDVGEQGPPWTWPSPGGPCRCELPEGPMSNALTLHDMSPGLRKVVGRESPRATWAEEPDARNPLVRIWRGAELGNRSAYSTSHFSRRPTRPRPPTPCHPAPAGAHAWGRPTRPTLPAWRRPCQGGHGGAHTRGGTALSGAGRPPARAAGHGQDGGRAACAARGGLRLRNGLFHRFRPPCRPRATDRGLPQLPSAPWRPPCAASAGRQTAAAGPARLG